MRIRHLLTLGVALAFSLVAARLVVLESSTRAYEQLDQFQLDVGRVSRDASRLLGASEDFLLRDSPGAAAQWQAMHAQLLQSLVTASRGTAHSRVGVDALRSQAHELVPLFNRLETAIAQTGRATASGGIDPSAEQLLAETRRIDESALALAETLVGARQAREWSDRRATRLTMVAFASLVLLISVFIARRVLRPLAGLEAAAKAVRSGALTARSRYRAGDEFGHLALCFDTMAESLEERTSSLDSARRHMENILDAVPSGIGYWDPSLHLRFANKAYCAWYGIEAQHILGLHIGEVLGDRFESSKAHVAAAMQGHTQIFERSIKRRDGTGERHSIAHYLPDIVDGEVRGFYCCIHDITQQTQDRTRLAAALRENDSMLGTINLNAIVSVADRAGRIIEVNDNFCRIAGYSRDELIGQNHRIVNSGVQPEAFWADMWRSISAGRPWRGEVCNRAKDGSLYWVASVIAPFVGEDGRIEKFISIRTDITAAKLAEDRLRDSEAFLDRAGQIAGVGGWQLDLRTQAIVWSAQTYRIHEVDAGYQPNSEESLSFFPLEARHKLQRAVAACTDHGTPWDLELPFVTATGRALWVRSVGAAECEGSQVIRLAGALVDITEKKRAEMELLGTSSLLRTVLDSASEISIIATDPQFNTTVFNAGAESLLGYEAREMVGRRTPLLIYDPNELEARGRALSEELGHVVRGTAVFTEPSTLRKPQEWTYVRKDGSRVCVSQVVTAMRDDSGALFGYLGIAHDVTRQKEHEESLREAMHKARQASTAKSQFLANMSHEIRTPMNAVIGLSYLLGETALNEQQAEFLAKLRLSSKTLLALINDILDLSKIEADEITIDRSPFSLAHVLKDLRDSGSLQADAKGIDFEVDAPASLPRALEGDAMRLTQILTNLLSNALKFTERGGITLRVRQLDASEGVRLRFDVQDSGIGIVPEVQASLFLPFAQGDTSMTRRFGGTGLGLSIVKRLVELMGGTVALDSAPGEGSVFSVELPFAVASPDALAARASGAPVPGRRGLSNIKVLVVDDSDINLDVAQRILELEGAEVAVARNGQEAYERLKGEPQAFDVVLMDVQMPVLDGYKATRRIRGELGLETLPVLALTAGALTSERQRAKAAGMNDFITKPFDPRALVRTIRRHVKVVAGEEAASPTETGAPVTEPASLAWPEIDGIDARDASERLGGDWLLFRSMLKRLLSEFVDLDAPADGSDANFMTLQAARMHKLKGSAGMLGAKGIQKMASDAEAACRDGQPERASQLAARLGTQLRVLRKHAAPLLDAASAVADDGAVTAPVVVDPRALAELAALLNQQSLAALEHFGAVAPQLRQHLGAAAFETLRAQVENLQFDAAAKLIEASLARA